MKTCLLGIFHFIFIFTITAEAQNYDSVYLPDSSYAFIVAGHAYGAHSGGNLGLHPAFLNSLDAGFDSNTAFFVFTGDIVNQSIPESWQQVENELAAYGLPSYYVMGNHDDNDIGWQVFEEKHGGTFYSFCSQSELFIVLNSTDPGRSISSDQIDFLDEQINQAGDTIRNIFIFFHEVLWNSHEKYIAVRANSRSRYDQIVGYSNYWEEIHPILSGKPDKNFFVLAGDVGGNPDAIATFYDTWDHITLIASGMGEVPDENYLLIHVHTQDSIGFELVPLNTEMKLSDISYYSVPSAPGGISGPSSVLQGSKGVEYSVQEVFNADTYSWELPEGITGSSASNSIVVDFDDGFVEGKLSVQAARDGYGAGPASSLMVNTIINPDELAEPDAGTLQIDFIERHEYLGIVINGTDENKLLIRLFDLMGRLLKEEWAETMGDYAEIQIDKRCSSKGNYNSFCIHTRPAYRQKNYDQVIFFE